MKKGQNKYFVFKKGRRKLTVGCTFLDKHQFADIVFKMKMRMSMNGFSLLKKK